MPAQERAPGSSAPWPDPHRSEYEWTPDREPACRCGRCLVCEVEALAGPEEPAEPQADPEKTNPR